ncbi:MAG: heme o synthase [Stackebrandtia sp.]
MRRNPTAAAGVVARVAESPSRPLIVVDTGATPRPGDDKPPPPQRSIRAVLKAYVALTKPRIVELLLITTVPAMLLAARLNGGGLPDWTIVATVVVGGAAAAGSANALNCYIDRDIDQLMRRTSRRPIPRHTVSPRSALVFGLVLGAASIGLLWAVAGVLPALLTAGAIAYYDVVYTMWLKRSTAANTVAGGVCGAAPVLIGWAAITGGLSVEAWILFAVVFFWQPPHFWALAVKYRSDYAAAGIPMLPVVASARRVGLESVVYAWLTLVASLALWPLATTAMYGLVAVLTGGLFCLEAHRMHGRARRGEPLRPMRLFHWSTTYLTVLFVALAVDSFLL